MPRRRSTCWLLVATLLAGCGTTERSAPIAAPLVTALSAAAGSDPAPAHRAPTPLRAQDVQRWLNATAGWRLPEEAFQFLGDIAAQTAPDETLVADPPALQLLRSHLHGAFPADGVTSAQLRHGRVVLCFAGPQHRSLPGSWGLASLEVSPRLVLAVAPLGANDQCALDNQVRASRSPPSRVPEPPVRDERLFQLEVVQGSIRIHLSGLLRLLASGVLTDMTIDTFHIGYAASLRSGVLQAFERRTAPPGARSARRTGTDLTVRVDSEHAGDTVALTVSTAEVRIGDDVLWRRPRPMYTWDVIADGGTVEQICSTDPPAQVHARPMRRATVRRGGSIQHTMRPLPGDVVLEWVPVMDGGGQGLDAAQADAALAHPATLEARGVTLVQTLTECWSGRRSDVDVRCQVWFGPPPAGWP